MLLLREWNAPGSGAKSHKGENERFRVLCLVPIHYRIGTVTLALSMEILGELKRYNAKCNGNKDQGSKFLKGKMLNKELGNLGKRRSSSVSSGDAGREVGQDSLGWENNFLTVL